MRAAATAEWLIDASREADTTHGTATTMNIFGHQNLHGVDFQRIRYYLYLLTKACSLLYVDMHVCVCIYAYMRV